MNNANSDSSVDSMRFLRNGKALPPNNINDGNFVPNLQTEQTSSSEIQQSHSSSNDPQPLVTVTMIYEPRYRT